jgi:hypothetical protein
MSYSVTSETGLVVSVYDVHTPKFPDGGGRAAAIGIRRDGWARPYKAEGLPTGQTKIATGQII